MSELGVKQIWSVHDDQVAVGDYSTADLWFQRDRIRGGGRTGPKDFAPQDGVPTQALPNPTLTDQIPTQALPNPTLTDQLL